MTKLNTGDSTTKYGNVYFYLFKERVNFKFTKIDSFYDS